MKYLLTGKETERLKFRLLKDSDFDTWKDMFKKENVARFLGLDETKSPEELCTFWFEKASIRRQNNTGGMNVLIDKKTNQLVGQCGILIQEIEGEEYFEIGYSILPKFWNMGYASEASQKCRNFAFENDFSNHLISMVNTDNIGSQKVALKNGMKLEKEMIYKGSSVYIFGMSKEDWKRK